LYGQKFGFPWDNTDILAGKDQFSNFMQRTAYLYLRTPKEICKSKSSAVKRYAVDDFYKIYFELVAECGIGDKSK
jgi:hypothetical protein